VAALSPELLALGGKFTRSDFPPFPSQRNGPDFQTCGPVGGLKLRDITKFLSLILTAKSLFSATRKPAPDKNTNTRS
jgi:hypothetical protein